jgi:hypothetical protein
MLSRARGLNIIVGAFHVYAESKVEFWEEICRSVSPDALIPVLEVVGS